MVPKRRKEIINPTRVFIAILVTVFILLAPVRQERGEEKPALVEYESKPKLALAIGGVKASCSPQCEIEVCVDWDPTPCGTNPWDIGCCLAYETQCNPECEAGGGGGGGNQPPTIAAVLTCSQNGNNGWCIGSLNLEISASDPQGSQVIISGDVNGTAFVCPSGDTTCTVPLTEGAGNANYRVDSATGLNASGSSLYYLDTSTPQMSGTLSGAVGANGWYRSAVTLTVDASDGASGIASSTVGVDGGPQTAYSAPIVLSDGAHTVVMQTVDNAGDGTEASESFKVDTLIPSLSVSLSGSMGANSYYVSQVTVSASASDSGSGIERRITRATSRRQ